MIFTNNTRIINFVNKLGSFVRVSPTLGEGFQISPIEEQIHEKGNEKILLSGEMQIISPPQDKENTKNIFNFEIKDDNNVQQEYDLDENDDDEEEEEYDEEEEGKEEEPQESQKKSSSNEKKDEAPSSPSSISTSASIVIDSKINLSQDTQEEEKEIKIPSSTEINSTKISKNLDEDNTCHLLLRKGIDIDISLYECFPVWKKKSKKNFIEKTSHNIYSKIKTNLNYYNIDISNFNIPLNINFGNNTKKLEINASLFFEDNFICFVDNSIINRKEKNIRRIISCIDIFEVEKIVTERAGNDFYRVRLLVNHGKEVMKNKIFEVDFDNYKSIMEKIDEKIKYYELSIIKY